MGKKLVLAAALVAFMAVPAFAAVQNVKVGGDIKATSVIRNSFDLGGASASNKHQSVILAQTDLKVQADLTDNVSANVVLMNERLWGQNATSSTSESAGIDVDTAYVTMKEMLYSPLTVTIGRQPLVYGNALIVGDGDSTTDVGAVSDLTGGINFDAVKAVLSYDPLAIDLFAAKVSEGSVVGQNDDDDTDLYGINANYKLGDNMNTVVEAYTFAKMDKGTVLSTGNTKSDKLYVPGLRVSTNPIEGLSLQLEGAYQTGKITQSNGVGKLNADAFALQAMANYALPAMQDMKPVLSLGYTYLSGDDDASDDTAQAWQVVYEDQFTGRIFDALFTNSNLQIANAAIEMDPVQDVKAKLSWYGLYQAEKSGNVTLNQPDGSSAIALTNQNGSKNLGNEVDLDLTYAYTEDVKFGLSAGYFFPGSKFTATNDDAASQLLTSVNVAF